MCVDFFLERASPIRCSTSAFRSFRIPTQSILETVGNVVIPETVGNNVMIPETVGNNAMIPETVGNNVMIPKTVGKNE